MTTLKPLKLLTPLALATLLGLAAAGSAQAAGDAHTDSPRHGGVMAQAKHIDYELVARPAELQLHVRDHGKPVDVAGASAQLTLLSGGQKQAVTLQPAGAALVAKGSFTLGPGTQVVAVLSRGGKPAGTVRFVLK